MSGYKWTKFWPLGMFFSAVLFMISFVFGFVAPMQDYKILTSEEVKELMMSEAWNYSLSVVLVRIAVMLLILSVIIFILWIYRDYKIHKVKALQGSILSNKYIKIK